MKPATDLLVDLAVQRTTPTARLIDLGGPAVPSPRYAGRRVTVVREDEALPFLQAYAAAPVDAVIAWRPTRFAPLLPLLHAARAALVEEGHVLLTDLVWQTAPTPELLRAFAPAAGREKVRPIEGYEMQLEHAGFDVEERHVVERERWVGGLERDQRAAVDADERGAARLMAWALRPSREE